MPYQPYKTVPYDYNKKSGRISNVPIYPLTLQTYPQNLPTPTPPSTVPLAEFDFNNYVALSPTINDSQGGSPATVYDPYNTNIFDTSTPGNYYYYFDSPNIAPSPTPALQLPSYSGITAIEMWVQYVFPGLYSQYVLDARLGAAIGYWITGSGAPIDGIGSFWDGGEFYNNTVQTPINSPGGTPKIDSELLGNGWCQLFFIPPTPITDDITLFARFSLEQGMPIYCADVAVYNTTLTSADVKNIFNSKCSRYGLPPIP